MDELRFVEVRAEGRKIIGTALRYGDVAKIGAVQERFEPGAFAGSSDVILNAQHDRKTPLARTGGGGLELRDSTDALRIEADLPATRAADDVLELIGRKVLRGLSIEFRSLQERAENGVRVIEKAALKGIAVVDTPAYPAAYVEAREKALASPVARRRVWL